MTKTQILTALAVAAAAASVASADPLDIVSFGPGSTEGLGAFTGALSYAPTGPNTATINITLTNTTEHSGGRITGFALRLPTTDPGATAVLTDAGAYTLFENLAGPVQAQPFGAFDLGAALGGNWLGGGSPAGGIAIGDSATFQFTVTASDAAALAASDFISTADPYNFVVRLRGFDNGGSDKVPGLLIPAPAAGGLLACCGLAALRRRRR